MHIGTHFKMLDMALGDTTYAEYEGLYRGGNPKMENFVFIITPFILKIWTNTLNTI